MVVSLSTCIIASLDGAILLSMQALCESSTRFLVSSHCGAMKSCLPLGIIREIKGQNTKNKKGSFALLYLFYVPYLSSVILLLQSALSVLFPFIIFYL